MPQLGLDPEQMAAVQKLMQSDAQQIRAITSKLDGQLKSAWWEGPDSKKFRGEWDGSYKAQLTKIAAALEAAAQVIGQNVAQQTQASAG